MISSKPTLWSFNPSKEELIKTKLPRLFWDELIKVDTNLIIPINFLLKISGFYEWKILIIELQWKKDPPHFKFYLFCVSEFILQI